MKLNGIEKNTETKKKSIMTILKRVSALSISVLIIGCILWGVPAITLIGAEEERSTTGANDAGSDGGFILPLVRPVFAQPGPMAGLTTFLEEEAGISAFTDVGRRIDLTRARGAFRTIERETANYILGSVGISGKNETWDVHVLVHRDGWIIAYYRRDRLTSMIINWVDLRTTNLEIALGTVAAAAGLHVAQVSYYNFKFANATDMLIIVDNNDFRINIPDEFTIYDRAFVLRDLEGDGTWEWEERRSILTINRVEIASVIAPRRAHSAVTMGTISPVRLLPDTLHTIGVTSGAGGGNVALILTYSEN